MEYLGISKINLDETSPVLPNIARLVSEGAFVLNFDFNGSHQHFGMPDVDGLERVDDGNNNYYRVVDKERLVGQAEKSYKRKIKQWDSIPASRSVDRS